ncbi:MAG: hypothetical protein QM737_00290 [Ferruginibacter sp.]
MIFYCYGCSNNQHRNSDLLLSLNPVINKSNDLIYEDTKRIQQDLLSRLNDPATYQRAMIWQPMAALVRAYSDTLINYLDSLKVKCKSEADHKLHLRGDEQEFKLKRSLENFKKSILSINEEATLEFEKEINTLPGFGNTQTLNEKYWSSRFKDEDIEGSLAILNMFESNTRVIENKMTRFFYYHTFALIHHYHKFSVLFSQTASIVKPGETITIEAGVGEFGMESGPLFKINRKTIKLNESAIASYKLITPAKPGEYTVPVSVEYYTPDGVRQSMIKDIKYTVFDTTRH